MLSKILKGMILFSILITGCRSDDGDHSDSASNPTTKSANTFGDDVSFLKKWDQNLVVLENGNARIIVSPKYQGKVFTSTADGDVGKSFGWINYSAFEKEKDPHMNAYGGEDRLWLGPEGGPFSLYFAPGTEMIFDNWHTPPPIDTEDWQLVSSSEKEAAMSKSMELKNYAGTLLKINLNRSVQMLDVPAIENMLAVSLGNKVKSVGFKTINKLQNTGNFAWDQKTGAPCMWNLDMFTPSPETVILVPYETSVQGKIATTDYFGEIPADRIKMEDGMLYFKADGHSRGKLGIPPQRAKNVAGSYAADEGVLTITMYDVDKNAVYLNQEWTTTKDPFTGDAVNAYNDGPLADGSQMGPFYEIESVSPAAFLKPGGEIVHTHSVFHFTGDKSVLNTIAEKVLGVSLDKVASVFPKN